LYKQILLALSPGIVLIEWLPPGNKYISHIPVTLKPLKKDCESEDDQENRPYGIVGINDGLIKHPVLAVEDN